MRQLSIEDLHRLILQQAAHSDSLDPWAAHGHAIEGRLQLKVNDDVENRIVLSVLGSLTFRNREQIRRLLNRLAQWPQNWGRPKTKFAQLLERNWSEIF